MKICRICVVIGCFLNATALAEIILYEGSLGNRPTDQGWIYLLDPREGTSVVTKQLADGIAVASLSVLPDKAGFFSNLGILKHPKMPRLDRGQGFTIRWQMKIAREEHSSEDRAGFSVIVLSNDKKGIELGFWTEWVWAQEDQPLFTRAETSPNASNLVRKYELIVRGESYQLRVDGLRTLTLRGKLRDYSAFGLPYNLPNFLFLGDNTTSAGAEFELGAVSIELGAGNDQPALELRRVAEKALELIVISRPGARVRIESSTDLGAWTELTDMEVLRDEMAVELEISGARFYRALSY